MPSGQGLTADRPRGIASEGLRVLAIDEHLDEKCLREAKIAGEARSAAPLRVCDRVTAAQRASKRKRGPKTPVSFCAPRLGRTLASEFSRTRPLLRGDEDAFRVRRGRSRRPAYRHVRRNIVDGEPRARRVPLSAPERNPLPEVERPSATGQTLAARASTRRVRRLHAARRTMGEATPDRLVAQPRG